MPLKGPLVKAYNTSSFSTRVEWDTLQEPYRLGVLTKYTVFYMNLKTHSNGSIDVSASVTSLDIDGLLPFNNHSFEVAAWTSKGMGSRGPVAFALTDEYGILLSIFYIQFTSLILVCLLISISSYVDVAMRGCHFCRTMCSFSLPSSKNTE